MPTESRPYAGIGSRSTPDEVLRHMRAVAAALGTAGFTLRSGGAQGSDSAFEAGARGVRGRCEIFLPWKNFEGRAGDDCPVLTEAAMQLAVTLGHPRWDFLSQGAKKLLARNMHQILGHGLDFPSLFVLCYTQGGSGKGGTGFALLLAKQRGIPIFDYGAHPGVADAAQALAQFLAPFRVTPPSATHGQLSLF